MFDVKWPLPFISSIFTLEVNTNSEIGEYKRSRREWGGYTHARNTEYQEFFEEDLIVPGISNLRSLLNIFAITNKNVGAM